MRKPVKEPLESTVLRERLNVLTARYVRYSCLLSEAQKVLADSVHDIELCGAQIRNALDKEGKK
jgi:hypothetical protein